MYEVKQKFVYTNCLIIYFNHLIEVKLEYMRKKKKNETNLIEIIKNKHVKTNKEMKRNELLKNQVSSEGSLHFYRK